MLQLHPGENFIVAYQIKDHTDNTTYYPQAVIRDAKTDVLLATLNLTEKAARRYTFPWQVAPDVSGQGRWVTVTVAVYEDSGHTTKSGLYAEEQNEYLVQARNTQGFGGGYGGDGAEIDYKKIRKIMREVIGEINFEKSIAASIASVLSRIDKIKMPPPEKFDLSPVMKSIEGAVMTLTSIAKAIAELPKPERVKFDEVKEHTVMVAKELLARLSKSVSNLPELGQRHINTHNEVLAIKKDLGALVKAYRPPAEEKRVYYVKGDEPREEKPEYTPDVEAVVRRGRIRNFNKAKKSI